MPYSDENVNRFCRIRDAARVSLETNPDVLFLVNELDPLYARIQQQKQDEAEYKEREKNREIRKEYVKNIEEAFKKELTELLAKYKVTVDGMDKLENITLTHMEDS